MDSRSILESTMERRLGKRETEWQCGYNSGLGGSHRDLQSEEGKRDEPLESSGLWFSSLSNGCVADLAFVMRT